MRSDTWPNVFLVGNVPRLGDIQRRALARCREYALVAERTPARGNTKGSRNERSSARPQDCRALPGGQQGVIGRADKLGKSLKGGPAAGAAWTSGRERLMAGNAGGREVSRSEHQVGRRAA